MNRITYGPPSYAHVEARLRQASIPTNLRQVTASGATARRRNSNERRQVRLGGCYTLSLRVFYIVMRGSDRDAGYPLGK